MINGETRHLWRAVDHVGEVVESYVTKSRDRKAALEALKTAMKRHSRPKVIVTGCDFAARHSKTPDEAMTARGDGGATTAQRIRICRSEGESAPSCGCDACEVYRSSHPFIPQSTTSSTRSVHSAPDKTTRLIAPPLLQRGAVLLPPDEIRGKGNGDEFAFV